MRVLVFAYQVVLLLLVSSWALGTLPVSRNVTIVRAEGEEGVCPPLEGAMSQVNDEIDTIIRDQVIPSIRSNSSQHPYTSCMNISAESPSGYYWIQTGNQPTLQYCDMTQRCCNTPGWMRIANLNFTDPNQQCPSGFRLISSPVRTCGRVGGSGAGCVSTTFQTHGSQYSKVCGKIIGYQEGHAGAFYYSNTITINDFYVDGVSLTHGSPRNHIWSFACAMGETRFYGYNCPCAIFDFPPPTFVGSNYFCDTGNRNLPTQATIVVQDPLWDGQGCGANACCTYNNAP